MLDSLYRALEHIATWPIFGIILVVFVLLVLGFRKRDHALGVGKDVKLLDGRMGGYTPEEVSDLMNKLGDRGRRIYGFTAITLDLIFPFVCGALPVILLIWCWGRTDLLLLPVIAVIADLLENSSVAYLAFSYKGKISPVARIASLFTKIKWAFFISANLMALLGVVHKILRFIIPGFPA